MVLYKPYMHSEFYSHHKAPERKSNIIQALSVGRLEVNTLKFELLAKNYSRSPIELITIARSVSVSLCGLIWKFGFFLTIQKA